MHFLIDYENVNFRGLSGAEFLQKTDKVTIFYSDCCGTIEQYRMQQIMDAGCELEIVKLVNKGKNALDFYIASKVAEILSGDNSINIGIVSDDKGFRAVRDYWKVRLNPTNRLIIRENIASCVISSAESSSRRIAVQNEYKKIDLKKAYEKYQEMLRVERYLMEAFANTEYECLIPKIINVIQRSLQPRNLYLNSLKTFGKQKGLRIYGIIKNNFQEYQKAG